MKTSALTATLLAAATAVFAATPPGRAVVAPRPPSPEDIRNAPRDGTRLLLLAGVFDPLVEELDFARVGLPASVDPAYGIVQFEPGQLEAKESLAKAGVTFVGYLPDNAFQVRLNNETRALLEGNAAVRFFGPYKTGYKVHPRLWPGSPAVSRSRRSPWPRARCAGRPPRPWPARACTAWSSPASRGRGCPSTSRAAAFGDPPGRPARVRARALDRRLHRGRRRLLRLLRRPRGAAGRRRPAATSTPPWRSYRRRLNAAPSASPIPNPRTARSSEAPETPVATGIAPSASAACTSASTTARRRSSRAGRAPAPRRAAPDGREACAAARRRPTLPNPSSASRVPNSPVRADSTRTASRASTTAPSGSARVSRPLAVGRAASASISHAANAGSAAAPPDTDTTSGVGGPSAAASARSTAHRSSARPSPKRSAA